RGPCAREPRECNWRSSACKAGSSASGCPSRISFNSTTTMKPLISKPEDLTPQTPWLDTKWAWTSEEELVDHQSTARLCAAALLPFREQKPDWEGFIASIRWMQAAADYYGV